MQPSINTTIRKNDVYSYGIKEAFFSTFSSKKATGRILAFACRQRFSSVSASCSFTGKELDLETGYGYHGARYMDYELMTCWLSVDPMADKYPNISPCNYCMWNPLKLTDPTGKWPWEPKHIRQARKYARETGGTLDIWRERNGVKFASVSFAETTNHNEVSVSITLFQPEGYCPQGEIKKASGFTNIELWMTSPAENVGDLVIKNVASIAYGTPNDLSKIISGKTLAGSNVTSLEKEEAFAWTAAFFISPLLRGTGIVTNTHAKSGLLGYNEFIKKNPDIIKRLSRSGAGNAFKRNKVLEQGLSDYNETKGIIQGIKEAHNDMVK